MERTLEVITKEYSDLCAKAGHIQYQVGVLSTELATLNDKLKELNLEAAALAKAPAVSDEQKS
jgi:hypothetical protein